MSVSVVDLDKCIGCGTCVESCPMDVFRLDTTVEFREEHAPCSVACPLGVRQREYHDLQRMGMLEEAAEVLRLSHPMPAVTGRLCPHPCESECTRAAIDQAVNINALEQHLGDLMLRSGSLPAAVRGAKVAIVGSGPAGLAAAYFLSLDGFAPTVFEKDDRLGGLLRTVVPAFRLPDQVLDAQIDLYRGMGISFRTGVQVGVDLTLQDLRAQGFGAVVVASGAARPAELSVPGSEAVGIVSAMDYLAAVKAEGGGTGPGGMPPRHASGAVAVIGGGSVALDAARTALRVGASPVSLICLERLEPGLKDSMPALAEEIQDAQDEGVVIYPSRGVHSFAVQDGRVSAVRCVECLAVRDEEGRFKPVYGDCVLAQVIEAETVIVAIGQVADPALVPAGLVTDHRGLIKAARATGEVASGLFACGDAVSGASTVVEALASGRDTAAAVARHLRGEAPAGGPEEAPLRTAEPPKEKIEPTVRAERQARPADERARDLLVTAAGFTSTQARAEAARCLTCGSRSTIAYLDDCQVCRLCQHYCPTDAIEVTEGVLLGSLHSWDVVELGRGGGR